ncbi:MULTISPECIES: hypothetical protein [unclassified Ekhidna]
MKIKNSHEQKAVDGISGSCLPAGKGRAQISGMFSRLLAGG